MSIEWGKQTGSESVMVNVKLGIYVGRFITYLRREDKINLKEMNIEWWIEIM